MSDSKSSSSSGGIGFFGLLAIVFITLKLCHVIDWSWWWVTAPLWGPAALFLAFLVSAGFFWIMFTILAALGAYFVSRRRAAEAKRRDARARMAGTFTPRH